MIHDAARPFISADTIDRVIAALEGHSCVLAAEPVADTLKRAGEGGTVAETVDRNGLWRAQTPQAFDFATILDLHGRAASAGRHDFTDDAALAEWAGLPVKLVAGSSRNTKITTAEDLAMADKLLGQTAMEPRTGTGFDVHRFEAGDAVWLCGVEIPIPTSSKGIPMPTSGCMHSPTRCWAPSATATSASIFRRATEWKGAASHLFLKTRPPRA